MVSRLKIADRTGLACSIYIFGRARGLDCGDGLIFGLDDDVVVLDFPQHPGEAGGAIGLVVSALPGYSLALRIAPAGVSAPGKSNSGTDDDLAKSLDGRQRRDDQH